MTKQNIEIDFDGMSFAFLTEKELKKLRTAPKGQYRVLQTEYYGDTVQRIEDFHTMDDAIDRTAELMTTESCCILYIGDDNGNVLFCE